MCVVLCCVVLFPRYEREHAAVARWYFWLVMQPGNREKYIEKKLDTLVIVPNNTHTQTPVLCIHSMRIRYVTHKLHTWAVSKWYIGKGIYVRNEISRNLFHCTLPGNMESFLVHLASEYDMTSARVNTLLMHVWIIYYTFNNKCAFKSDDAFASFDVCPHFWKTPVASKGAPQMIVAGRNLARGRDSAAEGYGVCFSYLLTHDTVLFHGAHPVE